MYRFARFRWKMSGKKLLSKQRYYSYRKLICIKLFLSLLSGPFGHEKLLLKWLLLTPTQQTTKLTALMVYVSPSCSVCRPEKVTAQSGDATALLPAGHLPSAARAKSWKVRCQGDHLAAAAVQSNPSKCANDNNSSL